MFNVCGCTGRTGRAGRPGKAVTFYTEEDIVNLRRYTARPFLLLSWSLEKQTNDKRKTWPGYTRLTQMYTKY